MNRKLSNGRSGFTLIEVVLAMGLLTLGLGSVALTINMAMKTSKATENQMAALHVARDQMERITSRVFDHPSLVDGPAYVFTNGNFTGSYLVTDNDPYKDVTVGVTWYNPVLEANSTLNLDSMMVRSVHF